MPGKREIRFHHHAAGPVDLGAGLLGDVPPEWVARHAGSPHLADALDPFAGAAVLAGEDNPGGVDVGDHDPEPHLDA